MSRVADSVRSRSARRDAVPLVVAFLALAMLLPSDLVVGGLGAAGRPSALFALCLFSWWVVDRLFLNGTSGALLIRWAVLVYLLSILVSYIAGLDRGLPGVESLGMDRELLRILGFVGVTLVVLDGVNSVERLERLLVWMVSLGAVGALVGIIQFTLGFDVTTYIEVPGLRSNKGLVNVSSRGGGFARVHGLSRHPIEFGVLMAMLTPIAIQLAMQGERRRFRLLAVGTIAAAIPMSISRAAVVGLLVGVLILAAGWDTRRRLHAFMFGAVAASIYQVVTPGLLGTLRGLFANADEDSSITARLDDYSVAVAFVSERPWFGRGPGTFLADIERYRVLDNEYLGTIIETGIIGIVIFLGYFGVQALTAWHVAKRSSENSELARSMLATLGVAVMTMATFDGMAYTGFTAVLCVTGGAIGALYRIEQSASALDQAPVDERSVAAPPATLPQPAG